MRKFPERQIDTDVEVIRITGRQNTFTIGSLFSSFTKLEILQITDSNVPAIGQHSFWGVQSLRMIGLYKTVEYLNWVNIVILFAQIWLEIILQPSQMTISADKMVYMNWTCREIKFIEWPVESSFI